MTTPQPERVAPLEEIALAVNEAEAAPVVLPAPAPPRDAAFWAPKVDRLEVDAAHAAAGFNIAGRRVTGPQQGFGRLWQRTYTATIGAMVTPEQLIAEWKRNFASFWPKGNRFYASVIAPGEVAPLQVNTGAGLKLATGVLVLYADNESFTFMTPERHMFAGWITFSAQDDAGATVARIQILLRTSDPLFEPAWPIMKRMEDRFWKQTMRNVALHFGVRDVVVSEKTVLIDKHRLWKNWTNIRHNAGIHTVLHLLTAPVRALRRGRRAHG